ncbi:histone-lysine N-methyltransferase SETMAR-like protein, partial [Dinothrombium tinctorium]
LDDNAAKTGRPVTVRTDTGIARVSEIVAECPNISIRRGAQEAGMSHTTFRKILRKDLGLFPYKIQITQPLSERNYADRLSFATAMAEMIDLKRINVGAIWFSDEAHFWLHGYVNKQNMRHWGSENPHVTEIKPLHPKRTSVWCAISARGIIGPYFIHENVNAVNYRALLEERFFPRIAEMNGISKYWFMQDGARPHRTRDVFSSIQANFGDRVIGLGYANQERGGIDWPPYSPDLNPCDFFSLGLSKG